MAGTVKVNARTFTPNEVGIAGELVRKAQKTGNIYNTRYRNAVAISSFAQKNPGAPVTTAVPGYKGANNFGSTPYTSKTVPTLSDRVLPTQAPPAPQAGDPVGEVPTVVSDTSIRDKVIPTLQQSAATTLNTYDQTKNQLATSAQAEKDKQYEREQKARDPIAEAFSEKTAAPIDPLVQKQLDNLDRLSQSTDKTTRLLAERQRSIAERKRQQELETSAAEQGNLRTSLSRLGARYTPGATGQILAQAQRGTYDKLAQIDDEETSAIEELRAAQEAKDFQTVDKKLALIKGVRDERAKVLEAERKATADAEKENTKNINEVLKDAAKNGAPPDVIAAIAAADDVASATTAASTYLQTGEYADYKRAVQAAGLTPVDPNTYYAKKIYGDKSGGGSDPLTSGDIPFQATIEGAASYAGSVTGEATAQKQLANLAKNGDYPALLNRIEALGRKGMGAQLSTDVSQAQNQIKAIDNMSSVLKKYEDAGGDMGFLKGTEQDIATRIGQLATDPKFASIATQLTAAFQQYRQQMTGAAFGASESAQYKSVFPSADKTFELNRAVMDGLRNFQEQNVNAAYETQLGEGYTNLKDYVEKGLTPTGKVLLKTEEEAKNKVIELGKQDPAVQSAVSGFIQDNPKASAYDVLQFLGVPVATSNEVSMTDPSNGIVGGYDIKSYATDPNHERRVAAIYNKTKGLTDASSVDEYIHRIAPNSPITGDQVMKASIAKGVTPGMILAIMEQDSTFGTQGKAVRTKNPGNVGNTDSGDTKAFRDWQEGVLAVAENLAKRKTS